LRLGSLDFSLERVDPLQSVSGLGKLGKIEAGCGRLIMDALNASSRSWLSR
jgi:hypothetical protein